MRGIPPTMFALCLLSACASMPWEDRVLTSSELSCVAGDDGVRWVRTAPAAQQPRLDAWCATVGPPFRHIGSEAPDAARTLVVISWNMNVGRGSLEALLTHVKAGLTDELRAEPPGFVLLLQEVYRAGAAVPESPPFPGAVPGAIRPPPSAPDIVQIAQTLGMSAMYVPSMRNGFLKGPQDRGTAILTTEPLTAPTAIELPFGRQRRVAAAATIRDIRFVSVHLDTSRARVMQAEALASAAVPPTVATVVAGDLNSIGGTTDGTVMVLAKYLTAAPCGDRRTHAWPWRLELFFGGWVGRLDHVFTTLPEGRWVTPCTTLPHFFGSDHRPLMFVVQAQPPVV
jgi:endonuclease/exonuclease/phosphatase family metal-dependent hydrolase